MTRSHKANDPVHATAESQTLQQSGIPKNFGKHSNHTEAPNRAKKNGGGRANWGRDGDEIHDSAEFRMHNARRRSNSQGNLDGMIKSKFEMNEEQPVFDESFMSAERIDRVDTESTTSDSTDKS